MFRFSLTRLASVLCSWLSVWVTSCSSLEENLEERYRESTEVYAEARADEKLKTVHVLKWQEALALQRANNIALKKARITLEQAQETKKQIVRDLMPSLRISGGLSRALTELGTIESKHLRFNVFSTIDVPGLVSLRARSYGASLNELRAKWSLELKERELIVQLREIFLEFEIFQTRRKNLERNQFWEATEARRPLQNLRSTPEELRLEQELFRLRATESGLQLRISKSVGSHTKIWELDVGSIPKLSYVERPLQLDAYEKVGVLFRQRLAADLEALRLRELGVKLRYLPDLSLGLSGPPLYQHSNGASQTISAENIVFRANSAFGIDTNRRIQRSIKDVRRQIELQNLIMREEVQAQVKSLALAQEEIALLDRELRLAELRSETLRGQPRPKKINELRPFLEKQLILSEQIANLRLRKAKIEGGFWILDESAWPRRR